MATISLLFSLGSTRAYLIDPEATELRSIAEPKDRPDYLDAMWRAVERPRLEDLHWIAGVFEGEGSFDPGQIRITQKEREILDKVQRFVGGRVTRYTGRAIGGGPNRMYLWYASGPRGRGIARTLFHLLSSRRQAQARAFLRISRREEPPQIDSSDPACLLWEWADDDVFEASE